MIITFRSFDSGKFPDREVQSANAGIILAMGSANGRWCYNVMLSLIGWTYTQNYSYDPETTWVL